VPTDVATGTIMLDQVWAFCTNHPFSVALFLFFTVRFLFSGGGGKFEEYPGNKMIASK
jgi:hypothetical protein